MHWRVLLSYGNGGLPSHFTLTYLLRASHLVAPQIPLWLLALLGGGTASDRGAESQGGEAGSGGGVSFDGADE